MLPLPRNIFPFVQRSPSTPRPRNAHLSPRNLKPLARPATPSRTCESPPDEGYEIGACYHGARALRLWATLHSKWPTQQVATEVIRKKAHVRCCDMVKFTDEGDNWVPDSVVAIVLEPGDTLIMPSAQLFPHAVLTLADSRMTGGIFMHALRILESIEKLLWISTRLSVSNEPIPLQLLRGWSHLRKLFYDRNQSTTDRARTKDAPLGAMPHPQGKNAEPPKAQAQYPAESGVVLMHKGARLPSKRQCAMSLPSSRVNGTQGAPRAQLRRPLGDPRREIANTRYDCAQVKETQKSNLRPRRQESLISS
ncbi:hypothetical protein Purlil1_13332 [Purpureocillium lilacinum]|uniref:JmjC domain-containing protein n=1 Tax=Purpureocillium lilacinum TaxID=33203 RepID=A0ABR0BEJ7_PURLI|nr:hypothetical protein Purlil1_13332 [Purpureocillium lilacinum]